MISTKTFQVLVGNCWKGEREEKKEREKKTSHTTLTTDVKVKLNFEILLHIS